MGKNQSRSLAPEELTDLSECTEFTEEEVQTWYKGFLNDCPSGKLTLSQFEKIYSKFFPSGDPKKFSAHTFANFDKNNDGYVDFREFLCALSVTKHGHVEDKLQWAFGMYDLNRDGYVTRNEMLEIVKAIYKAFGDSLNAPDDEKTPEQRVDKLFAKMDKNGDEKISLQEFIEGAKQDLAIVQMLANHHTADDNDVHVGVN